MLTGGREHRKAAENEENRAIYFISSMVDFYVAEEKFDFTFGIFERVGTVNGIFID